MRNFTVMELNQQKQSAVKPLLMTYKMLCDSLFPYCYGKKALIDYVKDIWKQATPTPQYHKNSVVKIITPKNFYDFINMAVKENG